MTRHDQLAVTEHPTSLKGKSTVTNLEVINLLRGIFSSHNSRSVLQLKRFNKLMLHIVSSPSTLSVFTHLLEYGACSSFILQEVLMLPEATAYRCMDRLKRMGLLEPTMKAEKHIYSLGGPRPMIWALIGSTTSQVRDSLNLHYHLEARVMRVRFPTNKERR